MAEQPINEPEPYVLEPEATPMIPDLLAKAEASRPGCACCPGEHRPIKARMDALVAHLAQPEPPSPERVALSLMIEEPLLPVSVALRLAQDEGPGPTLDIVSAHELVRLAAVGYAQEQT